MLRCCRACQPCALGLSFGMQELIVASYNAVLLNLFEVGLVVEEIRDMAFVGPYLI